jgi:glycosyltransferase involved in cell wall biosynthesis
MVDLGAWLPMLPHAGAGQFMRILHIIIALETGGAETLLQRLVMQHRGAPQWQHEIIVLSTLGPIGAKLQAQGFDVRALGLQHWYDLPRVWLTLWRTIRTARPDLVQTWMYHADLLGGSAARLAGCRQVIWSIHTADVFQAGSYSSRWFCRLGALLSHVIPQKIICVSDAVARAHSKLGYDNTRMTTIQNGVDTDVFKPSAAVAIDQRRLLGIGDNVVLAGCVARFNGTKDIATLVAAAGLAMDKIPRLKMLLVGKDLSPDNQLLRGWLQQTGQAENFLLLGVRDDIPACLAAMDIFCLSSLTEAFGLVVAEAMAMEKPCVVTDVDDLRIMLGDAGCAVPVRDAPAMATALIKLAEAGAAERQRRGQAGRQRVMAHYSLNKMVAGYEMLYKSVTQ